MQPAPLFPLIPAAPLDIRKNEIFKYGIVGFIAGFSIGFIQNADPFFVAKVGMVAAIVHCIFKELSLFFFEEYFPNSKSLVYIGASLNLSICLFYLTLNGVFGRDTFKILSTLSRIACYSAFLFYSIKELQRRWN